MRIRPRFFVVTFLIVSVVCSSTVITSYARELVDRWEQLKEDVGTAEALVETDPKLSHFIGQVMPHLINIDKEFQIEEQLREVQPEVEVEDVMAFAYQIATVKTDIPLGYWSEDPQLMYEEVSSLAHWFCLILSLAHLKPDDYRREMTRIRPTLSEGAYHTLIVALSLRTPLFEIPAQVLKSQPLPAVEKFVNLQAISMLEGVQSE